jgi:disulfide bond formation protein DsbB
MKNYLRFAGLLVGITLIAACDRPAPETEQSAASEAPAAAGEVKQPGGVKSVDADGNVAPFGMASKKPVALAEPAVVAAAAAATEAEGNVSAAVFSVHCAACHGPDAKGVEGLGLNLVDSELVNKSSQAELIAFLQAGRGVDSPDNISGVPMPAFAWMSESDLSSVTAYLQSL